MRGKMKALIIGILTIVVSVGFAVWTFLVQVIDVAVVGPKKATVGFSGMNKSFFDFIGQNAVWDTISDVLLIIAIVIAVLFFALGIYQTILRKNPFKVDVGILLLGGLYILIAVMYFVFELAVINYRPVLDNGRLVASYPSSHTFIVLAIVASGAINYRRYVKNNVILIALYVASAIIGLLSVVARLLSGQHWLTDVTGGVLLAVSLVGIYATAYEITQMGKEELV